MAEATLTSDPRFQSLMEDTSLMMEELARLSRKLNDLGRNPGDGANGHDVIGELQEHFRAFQERMKSFSEDSRKTISGLDSNVRSNPYIFVLGALGLGFLLGKAMRS